MRATSALLVRWIVPLALGLTCVATASAQVTSGQTGAGGGRGSGDPGTGRGGGIPNITMGTPTPAAPLSGTGAITGVVVDGATHEPLPDVIVALSVRGTLAGQSRQITDAKGRFAFVNLPATDSFTLTTSKFGYLDGGSGRNVTPGGTLATLALKDGEWVRNAQLTMWKPGAIAGIVSDDRGEPIVGIFVRVLARVRVQGREELAAGAVATTDDRGMYRLSGLSPGRYVVQVPSLQGTFPAATPGANNSFEVDENTRLSLVSFPAPPQMPGGRPLAYTSTFFPSGSTLAQAQTIDLGFGENRENANVALEPVPTVRVSGIVEGPADAMTRLTVRLVPLGLERLGRGAEIATALVGGDGRFVFPNVPAGTYIIDAPRTFDEFTSQSSASGPNLPGPAGIGGWGRTSMPVDAASPGTSFSSTNYLRSGSANYTGRTTITVGTRDENNVVVTLKRGGSMTGRVVVDGAAQSTAPGAAPVPQRFGFLLDPAGGNASLGFPRSDPQAAPMEFSISGLLAGTYWLRLTGGAPAWAIKSIQWGGRDYLHTPFDATASPDLSDVVVTVTNALPVLSGSVRTNDGAPIVGAIVLAFPTDSSRWTEYGLMPVEIRTATPAASGIFRMPTLPAGEYYVVAFDTARSRSWQEAGFFAQAQRSATRISLDWGKTATVDLSVVRIQW